MKGEISQGVITGLILLLVVVSMMGAGAAAYIAANDMTANIGPGTVTESGTVGAYVPTQLVSVGKGTVALTVES